MAKKTNPTPAKTAKKKPVTMAERVKHIERMVEDQCEFIVDTRMAVMERLDNIERLLATPQDVTGPPVTIPEQGLQAGDYTEASKEVADALTAMGWEWYSTYRDLAFFGSAEWENGTIINHKDKDVNLLSQAEFLRRASVTAKALGLVAKEEEPWKPEVGELVVCECDDFPETCPRGTIGPVIRLHETGAIDTVGLNGASRHMFVKEYRQPTPEEVAKYHADIEAAKPIVPYVTRVMCDGYEWRVICGMDQLKRYRIHRIEGEFEYCVSVQRHEFTVIDP